MKILLFFHTVVHIKFIQIWYQVYYRFCGKLMKFKPPKIYPQRVGIAMRPGIYSNVSYLGNKKFEFLNQAHQFGQINWNYSEHGKLWAYNLNYFEFLNQPGLLNENGIRLMEDFVNQSLSHKDAYEPYPISLRIINWAKFLGKNQIQSTSLDHQLYHDCIRLTKKLEYHLLANHLLENGFGLLFGAYYFRDDKLYRVAEKIILRELKEQILSDGAHYELSPMYHQIILSRVLDSYNLVKSNVWKQDELKSILLKAAQKMLSWIEKMTFQSGEIPMVNDATKGIAPKTKDLLDYAQRLNISKKDIPLGQSGYRMYKNMGIELLYDAGQIAPSYQPGHSHADNLNFVLNYKNKPIIVETGTSTYEKDERRQVERSTTSHNTVVINDTNSSQVWGGFRVGKRAKTTIIEETEQSIRASHNGYKQFGIIHERFVGLENGGITLVELLKGNLSNNKVEGYLHFHPKCNVKIVNKKILIDDGLMIEIHENENKILEDYEFCEGFNARLPAKKIRYKITTKETKITLQSIAQNPEGVIRL